MRQTIWYWAKGRCATEQFEIVSLQLFEAGVSALEELDPPYHAPDHGSTFNQPQIAPVSSVEFRFYTDDLSLREHIIQKFPRLSWETGEEPARDWDQWWRERQKPVQVSTHLWVRPPWVEFTGTDPSDIVLAIEAKSAFGTGEHESTSLCAELMESVPLLHRSLLDIGTGTGILAMYGIRRGAYPVFFTEIDPLTLDPIRENFRNNQCGSPRGILGGLECLRGEHLFDIIVCNMIRSEMWPLRPHILRLLKPDGYVILSGHLAAEQDPVKEWFAAASLAITQDLTRNEWWAVCARRVSTNLIY